MNRTILGVLVAVVAALAILGVVISSNRQPSTATQSNTDQNTTESNQPAGSGSQPSNNQTSEPASVAGIEMKGSSFSPANIKIKKGTTVTWTNKDSIEHDVVPDDPSPAFKGSGRLLSKGESYSFTFNTVGKYSYFCTPHASFMKGTIEVTE